MENKVRIKFVGKQAEGEIVEVDTEATYTKEEEVHVVTYREWPGDACMETETSLRFHDKFLEIIKKGEVNSKMEFEKGVKKANDYVTAYATFFIETDTKELSMDVKEDKISFFVGYDLYINNGFVSNSEVSFMIEPVC